MGTLPPNESMDFMLEFVPREVLELIVNNLSAPYKMEPGVFLLFIQVQDWLS